MYRMLSVLVLAVGSLISGGAAADFPVSVEHQFGTTTIPAKPQRLVVVGVHEQDFLYALGIAPIGVHEWFGDYPYANWPWADAARKAVGATPEVLKGFEINLEWVAALKPDLIVATYYGDLDQATYDLLSAIAPTIAAPKGYPAWGAPWQDELKLIGKATGTSDKAAAIQSDIEARFTKVRATNPQFTGKTAAVGYVQDGMVRTYNSADTAHRFLSALGFTIPAAYDEGAAERGHFDISPENLNLIELDAFVWPDGAAGIEELSLYKATRLAREGRSVSLAGGALSGALSFQTPLAIGYLLDTMPPMLAAAVDGDPATAVLLPTAD